MSFDIFLLGSFLYVPMEREIYTVKPVYTLLVKTTRLPPKSFVCSSLDWPSTFPTDQGKQIAIAKDCFYFYLVCKLTSDQKYQIMNTRKRMMKIYKSFFFFFWIKINYALVSYRLENAKKTSIDCQFIDNLQTGWKFPPNFKVRKKNSWLAISGGCKLLNVHEQLQDPTFALDISVIVDLRISSVRLRVGKRSETSRC